LDIASGRIVERVDPVFFSDLMPVAMKALGMTSETRLMFGRVGLIAQTILLPMASVRDIPTIPGELFAKFQTGFCSDPTDAV
jgi:predicted ATP-dependent Lon-type protease